MLNSCHEKPIVAICFGAAGDQRNITASITANRLKEWVYSIKEGIASPIEVMMSQQSPEIGAKHTEKYPLLQRHLAASNSTHQYLPCADQPPSD
jgi:hypothetical protein